MRDSLHDYRKSPLDSYIITSKKFFTSNGDNENALWLLDNPQRPSLDIDRLSAFLVLRGSRGITNPLERILIGEVKAVIATNAVFTFPAFCDRDDT